MQRGAEQERYTICEASNANPDAYKVRGPGIHTGLMNEVGLSKNAHKAWMEFQTTIDGVDYSAPALWSRLSGTTRSTALVMRGDSKLRFELRTVEHFLAAAYIYDLQSYKVNMKVDAHSQHVLEMPILDGSAKEWSCLKFFQSNAIPEERPIWFAVKDFLIKDEQRKVFIRSSEDHRCSHYKCHVDFGTAWIQNAAFSIDWLDPSAGRRSFEKNIAPARTFGFKHELEALVERGLIQGANLNNALLLDGDKVWNEEGFRVSNELAAHKLLDSIGDFALLGRPIIGVVETNQAGHYLHLRAVSEAVRAGALVPARLKKSGEIIFEENT